MRKAYRNPVALALEWRKAIDSGHYGSQADLARKKGISRARVTRVLNLLRLSSRVVGIIMDIGDPLHARIITERQLRRLLCLTAGEQLNRVEAVLTNRRRFTAGNVECL